MHHEKDIHDEHSLIHFIGTATLIHDHPNLLLGSTHTEQLCRKDTGLGKRLRKWSRGHQLWFVVEGILTLGSHCIGKPSCVSEQLLTCTQGG